MANTKTYNLNDSNLSKNKQFNKLLKKIANNTKMKNFLKNKNEKKFKHDSILPNNIIFIFYNQIIFIKNNNKLILRNIL